MGFEFSKQTFNIAILIVAAIYTAILLMASIRKRNKTISTVPFIMFCGVSLVTLICGIFEWISSIDSWWYKFLFVMDYALVYMSAVLFFWYVSTYTYAMKHPDAVARKKLDRRIVVAFIGYGIFLVLLFMSSIWTGWFYHINVATGEYFTVYYPIIYLLGIVIPIMNTIYVVRNRKIYGLERFLILLGYIVVPMIVYLAEYTLGLSFGYVTTALTLFVIYARVDNAQGETLLEEKEKLLHKEAEMAETRMELMMSQIQPHFLYNTLSSIAFLCTEDPNEAERAISEFAGYLETNLQSMGEKRPVAFEAELAHVDQYLRIEKRRFRNRLNIVLDIQEKNFRIPALTLQTLVENAVRYSVNSRYETSTVTISSQSAPQEYLVTIQDDGPGFDVKKGPSNDRRHIGLAGARYRLAEMMGGTIEINSVIGKGTTVIIHIPKEMKR